MFVLLNAGAVHRQGPFRLYVHLARRLAALGYASFRFDQPGIGDAVLAADRPQVALLSDVLDRLQANTGCTRFVVGGICSAADAAWQLAQKDQRVTGLLLLDPVAYAPRWFALGRLLRLRTPAALIASLRLRLIGLKVGQAATAQAEETDYREWPSPHAVAGQLASLCARGVEVFALYTGGIAHYFLHRRQFSATFGRASRDPRVRFQYWPEIDHLFYRPADRERVLSNLCAWAQERFPRDPLSAPLPPS
jgi:dienelactone hydrolase